MGAMTAAMPMCSPISRGRRVERGQSEAGGDRGADSSANRNEAKEFNDTTYAWVPVPPRPLRFGPPR
jgi:hypothetical protein